MSYHKKVPRPSQPYSHSQHSLLIRTVILNPNKALDAVHLEALVEMGFIYP